jgi:hypothetical protein
MRQLNLIERLLDGIAATDDEIIHATQEGVYFFFVVFLVHFELWPHTAVLTGLVLLLLAFFRFVYFLAPYFLQSTVSLLSPNQKLELISARKNEGKREIESLLHEGLHLNATNRLSELLLRYDLQRVQKLAGVE